jgi:hypothetical protein
MGSIKAFGILVEARGEGPRRAPKSPRSHVIAESKIR